MSAHLVLFGEKKIDFCLSLSAYFNFGEVPRGGGDAGSLSVPVDTM